MILLVKLVSIVVIVYGCFLFLRPKMLGEIIAYIKEGKRVYACNAIKAVIGVLLMLASSRCRIPWIVLFIGALMTFSGLAVFVIKKQVVMKIIEKGETWAAKHARLIGISGLIVGVLLALAV
ncbi:MAG: hypothetical protein ABH844_06955 [Candidatus Omnitrophota bacterium]